MPTHWVLSAAMYLDQFSFSVSSAVVSSARQAALLRPSTIEPRPAASQLESTCSSGGLSAHPGATCAPIPTAPRAVMRHAVLIARAVMATSFPSGAPAHLSTRAYRH